MLNMSPTSLVVSLQQLRQGATLDLGEVLKMEYRISQVMMQRKDFYEGIRAVLVDRDNAPVWGSTDHIAPYFASLGDLELQLPAKVADPAVNAGLVSQVEVEAALIAGRRLSCPSQRGSAPHPASMSSVSTGCLAMWLSARV